MANRRTTKALIVPIAQSLLVTAVWAFPAFWYTKRPAGQVFWFAEKTEIPGWTFKEVPVGESAEKVLVADRTFNGEFIPPGESESVRVFSAKRYEEKSNEIGLFIHTPDRCWVEAGWKIEPAAEDLKTISLHGARIPFERRIFNWHGRRELVYFCGLVGGQPLPYRLDHNLSIGLRNSFRDGQRKAMVHASDTRFWERLWESFASRRELSGPKQFVRISTGVGQEDLSKADERLEKFMQQWLAPVSYEQEKNSWKLAASAK